MREGKFLKHESYYPGGEYKCCDPSVHFTNGGWNDLEDRCKVVVMTNEEYAQLRADKADLMERNDGLHKQFQLAILERDEFRAERDKAREEAERYKRALLDVCASCQRHLCQDEVRYMKVPGRDIGQKWKKCQAACYVYKALNPSEGK